MLILQRPKLSKIVHRNNKNTTAKKGGKGSLSTFHTLLDYSYCTLAPTISHSKHKNRTNNTQLLDLKGLAHEIRLEQRAAGADVTG
jgi:hypothetical protein